MDRLASETCLRYSFMHACWVMQPSGPGIIDTMEQTIRSSAIPANTRGQRVIVFAMLFTWLAWLLTCANVTDGVRNLVPTNGMHLSHVAAASTHGSAPDDLCCTAAPHSAALATAHKLSLAVYFISALVPPVIVTSLSIMAAAANREFMRSSSLRLTENSPRLWTLWPQAPPR